MELLKAHNIALLSDDDSATIELHKSATFADFNQQRLTVEHQAIIIVKRLEQGKINRAGVKKLIDASLQGEKLRDYINQYRKVK